MRLIDADALKDKCYITVNGVTIGRNNYVMFHEIDDAPTIEPSGDFISREDAMEAVADMQDGSGQVYGFVCKALEILSALPTADRPTGKWKRDHLSDLTPIYGCSVCGNVELHEYNYCPNCGAKMGGEE